MNCFNCNKPEDDKLCNNCRFNENIMMTATKIKKKYK